MSDDKTLKIQKINNGIVIDHIPPGNAINVLKILKIEDSPEFTISVGIRVPSDTHEFKDIVKIEGRYLKPKELDKVSLIAPEATINVIKEYRVIEKHTVKPPEIISGILRCDNPNCITNRNEPVEPVFHVVSKKPIVIRCRYCGREMTGEDIVNNIL